MLITNAIRKKWTPADLERMVQSEIFAPDERVELIEGVIITIPPPTPQHAYAITQANARLVHLYGQTHSISIQNPLKLGSLSQPQPDFALIRYQDIRPDAQPDSADLVIEVSWSSLALDRNEKAVVYASGGIPEYWIVDLVHRQVEVLRDPGPSPDQPGGWEYRNRQIVSAESSLQPLRLSGPLFPLSAFFPTSSEPAV